MKFTTKIFLVLVIILISIVFREASITDAEKRRQKRKQREERRNRRSNDGAGACVSKDRQSCYENVNADQCKDLEFDGQKEGHFRNRCPKKATKLTVSTTAQVTQDV